MYTFTYMCVFILTEIHNLCMNEGNSTKGFFEKGIEFERVVIM